MMLSDSNSYKYLLVAQCLLLLGPPSNCSSLPAPRASIFSRNVSLLCMNFARMLVPVSIPLWGLSGCLQASGVHASVGVFLQLWQRVQERKSKMESKDWDWPLEGNRRSSSGSTAVARNWRCWEERRQKKQSEENRVRNRQADVCHIEHCVGNDRPNSSALPCWRCQHMPRKPHCHHMCFSAQRVDTSLRTTFKRHPHCR